MGLSVSGLLPGLPQGDWYGLAERAVKAFETYVNGEENEHDSTKQELELLTALHQDYADYLDKIINNNDQFKKMKSLRELASEARSRSAHASARLQSEYGEETPIGIRSKV
jgi:hypothetical protein